METIERFNGRQEGETAQAFGLRVLAFAIRVGVLGDMSIDALEAGIYAGVFAVANPEISPAAAEAITKAQIRMRRSIEARREDMRARLLALGFTDEPIVQPEDEAAAMLASAEQNLGAPIRFASETGGQLSADEIAFFKRFYREFNNDSGDDGHKVKRPRPRPSLPPSGVANPF